jgi:hypothetical protein
LELKFPSFYWGPNNEFDQYIKALKRIRLTSETWIGSEQATQFTIKVNNALNQAENCLTYDRTVYYLSLELDAMDAAGTEHAIKSLSIIKENFYPDITERKDHRQVEIMSHALGLQQNCFKLLKKLSQDLALQTQKAIHELKDVDTDSRQHIQNLRQHTQNVKDFNSQLQTIKTSNRILLSKKQEAMKALDLYINTITQITTARRASRQGGGVAPQLAAQAAFFGPAGLAPAPAGLAPGLAAAPAAPAPAPAPALHLELHF